MSDYSWIKPGVKAVINYENGKQEFVTITSDAWQSEKAFSGWMTTVDTPCPDNNEDYRCCCSLLRPYKDDQDKLFDWKGMAKKNAKPCVDWKPERVSA